MNSLTYHILEESTLADIFLNKVSGDLKDRSFLHYKPEPNKPYQSITFGELGERVAKVASGLLSLGIQKGDRIALISESRPEWLLVDFASILIGAITVPMFPTLPQKQVEYILIDSCARIAIVSNELQFGKVARSVPNTRTLERIFICNERAQNADAKVDAMLSRFSELEEKGYQFDMSSAALRVQEEDVVTYIYTSGTTGIPKGVMLTHRSLVSNVKGATAAIPPVTNADIFLSFLPLSHSFERLASYLAFSCGSNIAYASSIDSVAENMLEVKPTIMTGVPRFYERVHQRVMKSREKMPTLRRKIFDWAMSVGGQVGREMEGLPVPLLARIQHPLADTLVLSKIRERTGGRIRFLVSGAAALSEEVGRAFSAFGIPLLEGYGMTESSPVISVTPANRLRWGRVGPPIFNVEVKIAEDGEILTRGPHIMKGYHNQPTETAEAIDKEGWLHTGDIGDLDSENFIRITDRKKHLFVSSGGKNIAPAPIEGMLLRSELIDQVLLIGDKRQFVTALLVPDYEIVKQRLRSQGEEPPVSHQALVKDPEVRKMFEREIEHQLSHVANYERVRRFVLLEEPFTIENSMLTPTLKVKRTEAEERYRDLIDSLYVDARKVIS
jgi:long-chain acyl-CoA synthetase